MVERIDTRLTRLWGIDKPIIGAPMAGRSDGHLAAAVSRAGGLGMFGAGAGGGGAEHGPAVPGQRRQRPGDLVRP